MVDLYIPQPVSAEIYYATRSIIDWNNQIHCDDIELDNNVVINSCDRYFNLIVFGVSIFYTYNVATKFLTYEDNYRVLLYALDEDIINNDKYFRTTRPP